MPRPDPSTQCHLGPRKPTFGGDVPSTLVSRSPERNTQHRGPDSHFPPVRLRGSCSQPPSPPSVRPASLRPPGCPPSAHRALPGGSQSPCSADTRSNWDNIRSPGATTGAPGALSLTPFSPTSKTGYLVHALQTTLWTFSLLFKSPPGKEGKKIQRRSESIEKKKKIVFFSKRCPQRRKR